MVVANVARYHKHFTQRVPSDPYWRDNCSAYCLSMLIMDETVGGLFVSGETVRHLSDEPIPDPNSPGLRIQQLIVVAHDLRVYLDDKTGETFTELRGHVKAGARAGIQIDYKSLGTHRCQTTGDFGHMGVIVDFSADGKTLTMSDPLCLKTNEYPSSVVANAATVFAKQTGINTGIRFCTTKRIPRVEI